MQSVAEVEDLIWRVEGLAGGSRKGRKRESVGRAEGETCIDLVAISHEFTDHCHKETLMDVHRDVPVFAADVSSFFPLEDWNRKHSGVQLLTRRLDWRILFPNPLQDISLAKLRTIN